jgi:hypothetical protein
MEAKKIPTWEGFEEAIGELRAKYGNRSLVFRGQSDSEWPLTNTLERNGQGHMTFLDYYRLIVTRIGPAVETFIGVSLPEYSKDVWDSFSDHELLSLRRFPSQDLYRYMVYLRHHAFPSPLLDWSRSPYVAAFFAFRDQHIGVESRSIYAYCEMPEGHKGGAVGEPTIQRIGPYVRSHRRHFLQQSDYTICGAFDANYGWHFYSHQEVFSRTRPGQDALWKFDLPSSERLKVLRLLDDYNLNASSLFGSEESLLETMWFREQVRRNPS